MLPSYIFCAFCPYCSFKYLFSPCYRRSFYSSLQLSPFLILPHLLSLSSPYYTTTIPLNPSTQPQTIPYSHTHTHLRTHTQTHTHTLTHAHTLLLHTHLRTHHISPTLPGGPHTLPLTAQTPSTHTIWSSIVGMSRIHEPSADSCLTGKIKKNRLQRMHMSTPLSILLYLVPTSSFLIIK